MNSRRLIRPFKSDNASLRVKITLGMGRPMSALCQKQTFRAAEGTPLFDDLVGASEHRRWQCEAERLGGLEIDHQLVLGRHLHRHIGWLLALEDAIDVAGSLPIWVDCVRSKRNKATVRDEITIRVSCW